MSTMPIIIFVVMGSPAKIRANKGLRAAYLQTLFAQYECINFLCTAYLDDSLCRADE